jgi:hypothetical protein
MPRAARSDLAMSRFPTPIAECSEHLLADRDATSRQQNVPVEHQGRPTESHADGAFNLGKPMEDSTP